MAKPPPAAPGPRPAKSSTTSSGAKGQSLEGSEAPGKDRESTVEKALNALSACAETLVSKFPEGTETQVCMVQLDEARRLISQLGGPAPAPPRSPLAGTKPPASGRAVD